MSHSAGDSLSYRLSVLCLCCTGPSSAHTVPGDLELRDDAASALLKFGRRQRQTETSNSNQTATKHEKNMVAIKNLLRSCGKIERQESLSQNII